MRLVRMAAIGMVGLWMAAASASAATDSLMKEFNLSPGIAAFTGSAHDYASNSFSLDASLLHPVHEVVQIGGEVGYIFNSDLTGAIPGRLAGGSAVNAASDVHLRTLHLTPEIKIGPVMDVGGMSLNPYIIGGGGLYWTHYTNGTLALTGTTTNIPRGSANDVNGGYNVGGGLSIKLPQNTAVGFEIRYHHVMYKNGDDVTWIAPAIRLSLLLN